MNDYFQGIVGQHRAVEQLRAAIARPVHAYMFVGPAGSGKRSAALAFAAALLDDDRALRMLHPDVSIVEREGASVTVGQAREISRLAALSPVEGSRKVLILTEFHLAREAGPALLKTIEEATDSTVFVVLAESVPKDLVTVASRCVRVEFCAMSKDEIVTALVAEGADEAQAHEAAEMAAGNIDRARLLISDPEVAQRHALWRTALERLDGSGSAVATLVDEVIAALDHASAPLLARQERQVAEIETAVKAGGRSMTVLKNLQLQHKREQRRLRADDLKSGFAILAGRVSQLAAVAADPPTMLKCQQWLDGLSRANESMEFNPNEALLLQALFCRLSTEEPPTLLGASPSRAASGR